MVSTQKVKDVAENARINLEEDEAKRFAKEFESILEVFDKLDQIDTDDVEPAFHPIDTGSEARKDIKEESLDKKRGLPEH